MASNEFSPANSVRKVCGLAVADSGGDGIENEFHLEAMNVWWR
jgi:hypothetical protein